MKSHRKKSNLRRAFSLKKHGSKDSKRTEASGTPSAASPEARLPKKHGFLPTCVSGHRASISGDPGEQASCCGKSGGGQFSAGHPPKNSEFPLLKNKGVARSVIVFRCLQGTLTETDQGTVGWDALKNEAHCCALVAWYYSSACCIYTNTVPSHLTREVRLMIPFVSGEGGVQTDRAVILLGGSHGLVPMLF